MNNQSFLRFAPVLLLAGGLMMASGPGGCDMPGPVNPITGDVLGESFAADRITQAAVLRELAQQPFDGTTDDGRRQAGEWFNANRFRDRAEDYRPYTDAVAESIASNSEDALADKLEAK